MTAFILNNKLVNTNQPQGMAVLDFIRYEQNLKGTKIGCREGDCGACTVLVGDIEDGILKYKSMTSCLMPLGNAHGKHIVSVEGINSSELNPVQQAIVNEGGTQCGFCTVGFVMSLVGFCLSNKTPDYTHAIAAIDGNICRCTGYKSLERAANSIVSQLGNRNEKDIIKWLVEEKFIPTYFLTIEKQLKELSPQLSNTASKIKVAGGTDLYVQKHDSMIHADIDFLFDSTSLKGIKKIGNTIHLGASTTVEDIRNNKLMNEVFPNLKRHTKLVSSTPIRNMASLAGNFVNASPIGDMSIFFLALNAAITLSKNGIQRTILLKDFYRGYKTLDISENEIIEEISFECPTDTFSFNFEKVSKRTHLDIASVNSAILIQHANGVISNVHAAVGGVYAFPRYLVQTSAYLNGKRISESALLEAAEIMQAEIAPISDARGNKEYKRLLARQLFYAHFIELFPELIQADQLLLPV
jgi:xanthine dehydrogenase small subunit